LVGLLPGSSSGSFRGALPNVLYEEQFFMKNRGAGAVLEDPKLLRILQRSPSGGAQPKRLLD
jgi:hypothetical protein